jgi:Flp pilus assembly protein CpaB
LATSVTPSPAPAAPGSAAASKIFLAVAVLLGVLATLLAFMFINSAGAANTGTPILVTVAKRDLPANTMIDPSRDLKTMPIPPQFAALRDRSLDTKALNSYKGTRLNREIFQDQPVLLADIAPFSAGDLVLEKPFMALSLPADPGMIIPGDYVKIILARPNLLGSVTTMPEAGMPQSDVIVVGKDPGFKVLAVGGSLFKTRQQAMASDQYGSAASANKTVTLQVTEAQAREIMNVLGSLNSANRVTLLLCPSAKTAPPETPPAEPPAAVTSRPATGTRS